MNGASCSTDVYRISLTCYSTRQGNVRLCVWMIAPGKIVSAGDQSSPTAQLSKFNFQLELSFFWNVTQLCFSFRIVQHLKLIDEEICFARTSQMSWSQFSTLLELLDFHNCIINRWRAMRGKLLYLVIIFILLNNEVYYTELNSSVCSASYE